jgi:GNAT superfamily N-acetyltransferase
MTNQQEQTDTSFLRGLETVEVAAWSDFHRAATTEAVSSCGVGLLSTEKACGAVASKIDVLAFNRVIGLGLVDPVPAAVVADVIDQYRSRGVPRFFVQMFPGAANGGLDKTLEAAGFSHYNNWVKLYRSIEPELEVKSDLILRPVAAGDADAFGRIVVDSFEWPRELAGWIAATVGRPGWRHYMAFDGDTPVATGAFFVHGEYAWIDFAATLADYRGRGAQSSLLARRIQDARQLGCRWLVVETAEQTVEHEAPSYRNMVRYGFTVAYVRPNYLIKL